MRVLLVQQGILDALERDFKSDKSMTKKDKIALLEKAHSAIVLNLGDIVPRQVSKDTTGLWTKLESLYMTESMVNRLYLKQALYSFKMSNDKVVSEQLNEFNKFNT